MIAVVYHRLCDKGADKQKSGKIVQTACKNLFKSKIIKIITTIL
ncbi:MAG: hypothetical protein WB445_10305 [Acinetobacter sp.]